jgi:hypothetical protein
MTCTSTDRDQRLDNFLMNKLSAAEAEAFEIHLFGCKECLAELRMREEISEILKKERTTVIGDAAEKQAAILPAGWLGQIIDLLRMAPNAWIYAGVAATLVIALVVVPVFHADDVAENHAANFAASPRLESLVGQPLRSADFSVEIVFPRNAENFVSEDVSFRWQIKKGKEEVEVPLELKILNNQETLIHSARIAGKEYHLRESLAPGLYYWTLEYEGESLYLGKFFLSKPTH